MLATDYTEVLTAEDPPLLGERLERPACAAQGAGMDFLSPGFPEQLRESSEPSAITTVTAEESDELSFQLQSIELEKAAEFRQSHASAPLLTAAERLLPV